MGLGNLSILLSQPIYNWRLQINVSVWAARVTWAVSFALGVGKVELLSERPLPLAQLGALFMGNPYLTYLQIMLPEAVFFSSMGEKLGQGSGIKQRTRIFAYIWPICCHNSHILILQASLLLIKLNLKYQGGSKKERRECRSWVQEFWVASGSYRYSSYVGPLISLLVRRST